MTDPINQSARAIVRQLLRDDEQRELAAMATRPLPPGIDGLAARVVFPVAAEVAAQAGILPAGYEHGEIVLESIWRREKIGAPWLLHSRELYGPPGEGGVHPPLGPAELESA